jgi:hypothetical protein
MDGNSLNYASLNLESFVNICVKTSFSKHVFFYLKA